MSRQVLEKLLFLVLCVAVLGACSSLFDGAGDPIGPGGLDATGPTSGGAPGGEPCTEDDECESGVCDVDPTTGEGTCTDPGAAGGEPCMDDAECESGVCEIDPVTGEGTCTDPDDPDSGDDSSSGGGGGEPCETDDECERGVCEIDTITGEGTPRHARTPGSTVVFEIPSFRADRIAPDIESLRETVAGGV